jgi:hypothetical protein
MNWFETNDGHWVNLDQVIGVLPPKDDHEAEISYANNMAVELSQDEWLRLCAQLRNGQRPADRRPEPAALSNPSDLREQQAANKKEN